MKVLLYFGNHKKISKSGIGTALQHQCEALKLVGIDYTFNPNDDYDLAHINIYWPKAKRILKKIKKRHIPIIMHGHSTIEDFKNSFKCWKLVAKLWYNKNLLWFYKNSDAIIAPTEYAKKLIDSYNLKTPTFVVSNGINLNNYKKDDNNINKFKDKFNIKNEKVVIGVGFYFERKGIIDFFEIAKNRPDIKFIWFGYLSPILQTHKIKKAIKNKPNNVILPGYINNEIIKGAFSYANCFLFPTYEETEGIVVLESLASNCPTLIRDIGVYENWLIDEKNCFKAINNKEFINRLDYILSNNVDIVINEGFKTVSNLSIDKVSIKLKETYQKVIDTYKNNK